jgi:translocator protein
MLDIQTYYESLSKPRWTPSTSLIGTMWTILYPIIFVVLFLVGSKYFRKEISGLFALPFLLNIICNFAFTPVQFGLRSQLAALVVILLILITTIWCIIVAWSQLRIVSFAYIPYLLWVSVATLLQANIWWMNR